MKVSGCTIPSPRVVPPYERFDAENTTILEVEDGLIQEEELVAFNRGTKVELECEPVFDGSLHLSSEGDEAVLASGLRLVQGNVGVAEQVGRGRLISECDSNTCGDSQAASRSVFDLERFAQHLEETFGDEVGTAGRRGAFDENDELVTAEASDGVGLSKRRREPCCHRAQELITGFVSERVVHMLKTIEIDEQGGAVGVSPACPCEHLIDAIDDECAIR